MPLASRRPCPTPGCPTLVAGGGHCPEHRRAREHERGTRTARGYDNRWLAASKAFLLENPYCVIHRANGEIRRATVTDHIKAHKGNQQLFWDASNWQALCKECHDRKTATVDSTFGRL